MKDKQITVRRLPWALFILFVAAWMAGRVLAKDGLSHEKRVEPEQLIGTNLKRGQSLPGGWLRAGGLALEKKLSIVRLKNPKQKQFAIALVETQEAGFLKKEQVWKYVDVIETKFNSSDDAKISLQCSAKGNPVQEQYGEYIAEVIFRKRCDKIAYQVKRAWHLDVNAKKLVPLTDPSRLVCQYAPLGIDEGRPGCVPVPVISTVQ